MLTELEKLVLATQENRRLTEQLRDHDLAFEHANEVVGKLEADLVAAKEQLRVAREALQDISETITMTSLKTCPQDEWTDLTEKAQKALALTQENAAMTKEAQ